MKIRFGKSAPLAILLLAVGWQTAGAGSVALKDSVPNVTTTGRADAEVSPDEADLRVAVAIERIEAQAATEAVAEAATAIVADAKAKGVDAKDIRTDFELAAQYDRLTDANGRFRTSKLRGYLATETITVHLRDMTKVGPMARALIDNGANTFRGVSFRFSKEKERRKQLAADAMRDALAEAKIYTDAVGLKLGRALQVANGMGNVAYPGGIRAGLAPAQAPPVASVPIPTEPGIIELSESVTVVWEIEGKAP